ncbi:uncharacterized protein PV09_05247 [Verruconis gallopava]|uniref:Uncharacterized protein n=1 Tax=Verruconis gallopava TaxID=253628 RepID=A0A0D2AA91_9PEZI|nr:uncharacterized protein PV09_05247 [Verruconis gallopava]KIW03480.1 hypothetical protein PV09_05247 [Verruconis gallopava]
MLDAERRRTWMKERSREDQWLREAYDTMTRWPENVHDVYQGYRSAVQRQSQLVENESLASSFCDLLRRFPRLHTLREAPWYEGWFDPPHVRSDGTLDEISWYVDMLKPKDDILFKSEDLEEEWDGVHVFRSSILKARTLASQLFFAAASTIASSGTGKALSLRKISVTITLDGWYTLAAENSTDEDSVKYRAIMRTLLRDIETSNISGLKELRLVVASRVSEDELKQLLARLRNLLDSGASLTDLTLRIQTSLTDDFDMLVDFGQARMPCLKSLELIGATTTDQSLWTLLRNHATTLRSLSFREVFFAFSCCTWSRFLLAVPKYLSLDHFDADCIVDSGDPYHRQGWIGPHSTSLPGLKEYICSNGPWLGLLSLMDEAGCESDNDAEQADSGWDWSERPTAI